MTGKKRLRRVAGQTIPCGWCRELIEVQPSGRLPKWCSANCRHRAWEQRRAVASDRRPVEVVDRAIEVEVHKVVRVVERVKVVVPPTGRGWPRQLEELAKQVETGRVYDRDLLELAEALQAVLSVVQSRPAWEQLLRRRAWANQRQGIYGS